ncbi:MAG: superoxide dismutase family protein [Gemmatimonadota bacterium]
MKTRSLIQSALALAFFAGAFGCVPSDEIAREEAPMDAPFPAEQVEPVTQAVAVLHPTEGNEVSGIVHFVDSGAGIRVIADVEGLSPGPHGFHVHQFGDCSAPDGTSAGGHFDPDDMPHGAPTDTERHVGDLGNISADDMGVAHFEWTDTLLSFRGTHSIVGRGVIVHAQEDDFTTQPTGDAGPRLACGVIGIAEG